VHAFNKIRDDIPAYTLKIIGDGPELEKIRETLERNTKLGERVELLGNTSKTRIAEEMKKADVFVFPSEHETFGLVVAEAMASGLPVVTAKSTVFPEYVTENSGILVNPTDVEEISRAIKKIACSLNTYDSERIRSQIVDRFSIEIFGKKLLAMYNEILS